ncbi:hypothetical protein JCM8097_009207 [Rhodosporidiobolus ruineniae]
MAHPLAHDPYLLVQAFPSTFSLASMPDIGWSHPVLFALIGILAAAQVGLTGYQVYKTDDVDDQKYRNRLIFMLFTAAWTLLFFFLHALINLYLGLLWTLLTFVFWTVASALYTDVVDVSPGHCDGSRIESLCRNMVATKAIGWTEVALTALLIFALVFTFHSGRRGGKTYNDVGYGGFYRR